MKIHKIQYNSLIKIPNINLAIGNFDGIHLGHQAIIRSLINQSNKMNIESAIMSFMPHPRQFFSGNNNHFNIISNSTKIQLLKNIGVKNYILLNFDNSIASLSPIDFIENILVTKLNIKNLVVGNDFKFGKDREGNVELLKQKSSKYEFTVDILDSVILKKTSETISSSIILECM